jgi:oligopeptide/dipeptide ABC transporter ATP-binding protein
MPLFEAKNLTKIYGGGVLDKGHNVALDNFSLTISGEQPHITTIAGESGSGKTTLANLVLGFLTPTSGEILYRDKNIWKMSRRERFAFRREVQAIFQDPYGTYNPFYKVDSVFQTVISKFKLAHGQAEAQKLTENALEVVGLRPKEILGKFPHQLSGGQRQRIMIARAFLLKPRLIVADEPVSMIDASLQVRILEIFQQIKSEFNISFLYITHDLSTAYQISDDIFVLYRGSVMERGAIDAVIQKPQHPYTQLLINSVPVPDPDIRWEGRLQSSTAGKAQAETAVGCKFAGRCPHVMPKCLEHLPPEFEIAPDQHAACYLYESVVQAR